MVLHRRACGLLLALVVRAGADQTVQLTRPEDGYQIATGYRTDDFRIELTVRYRQPGTILDTVGLNAAPTGSFNLRVGADGRFVAAVYAPSTEPQKPGKTWQVLTHPTVTAAETDVAVALQVARGQMVLEVGGRRVAQPCPSGLSGQPIYLGDFKGDEQWGNRYNIHQGMVGTVMLRYFGTGKSEAPAPPAPAATDALVDETGTLDGPARAAIAAQLARLLNAKGVALGLVLSRAEPEQAAEHAQALRRQMLDKGTLPTVSGLFLISGTHFYWTANSEVAKLLTFEQLKAAWLPVAAQPPGQALLAFVSTLAGDAVAPNPPNPPVPPGVAAPAAVTERAARLETALRAGNAAAVAPLLSPDLREACGRLFAEQPQAMARLAGLLATRRFITQGARTAQFEVTDNGRRYPLTFLDVDGQWLLAGF